MEFHHDAQNILFLANAPLLCIIYRKHCEQTHFICVKHPCKFYPIIFDDELSPNLNLQGVEYGTDEEEDDDEEVSPPYPSAIEVFDLAENEDMSPLETDPEKLAHKYKEVRSHVLN